MTTYRKLRGSSQRSWLRKLFPSTTRDTTLWKSRTPSPKTRCKIVETSWAYSQRHQRPRLLQMRGMVSPIQRAGLSKESWRRWRNLRSLVTKAITRGSLASRQIWEGTAKSWRSGNTTIANTIPKMDRAATSIRRTASLNANSIWAKSPSTPRTKQNKRIISTNSSKSWGLAKI